MEAQAKIFQQHYEEYCRRIGMLELAALADILGADSAGNQLTLPLFHRTYRVSGQGIFDAAGNQARYGVAVILAKYVLLCPDRIHCKEGWASFKDFKKTAQFTNTNFFASDTEQAIGNHFSGQLPLLKESCRQLAGVHLEDPELPYDLVVRFAALPRIALLLLFNDQDEEFPAQCTILFARHAEYYLDPESLAMTGAWLAKSLIRPA